MGSFLYGGGSFDRGASPLAMKNVPLEKYLTRPGEIWGVPFDDCVLGAAHATTGTTLPGFIVSEVTAGYIQPGQESGGSIVFNTPATDNNGIQAQTGESFLPVANTNIVFGARIKLTDADQQDVFIGLTTADTDVAQSIPNDAIGFSIVDASANILYQVSKDGTGTATDTKTDAVNATYINLECRVFGTERVEFYIAGALVKTVTTNIPDDEELAFTMANVAGEGTANAMTIDWFYAHQFYIFNT